MSAKATVTAAANIAFIKYWGVRDLDRVVPANPSISMTLGRCFTRTTVEFEPGAGDDDRVWLADPGGGRKDAPDSFAAPIGRHLDRIREQHGLDGRFSVATFNSFPAASGMASSASGFAALSLAATRATDVDLSVSELSVLARMSGSGSAARSVMGGFVEWPAGPGDDQGHAVSLAPASHWDLRDVIVVVESGAKEVSSRDGHRRAGTSPHFETRQRLLPGRLERIREAIETRDLSLMGPVVEEEAIELHLIAMSSRPPIFYWKPETLRVLETVRLMRRDGVEAYSTMDAGANVHVICLPRDEEEVTRKLESHGTVVRDGVGDGPKSETEHLF